jgi:hypothetical protein
MRGRNERFREMGSLKETSLTSREASHSGPASGEYARPASYKYCEIGKCYKNALGRGFA